MAQFRSKPFGVTKNGDKVDEYIISNPGGLEISVLNYGCVIKNLFVPTKTGLVDVVVGHDTLDVGFNQRVEILTGKVGIQWIDGNLSVLADNLSRDGLSIQM